MVAGTRVVVRKIVNARVAPSQHLIVLSSGSCVLPLRNRYLRMSRPRKFLRPLPVVLPMDVD
jgi:hypothetical protein